MASLNKVMIIGHLGRDPEKRVTQQGHTMVTVNLATTEKFTSKDGNKQERTEWHRVIFWNKLAEIVEQYCKKGSSIYIEGSLQTREWQDKDGNRRWTTEITARNMQMLGKSGGNSSGTNSPTPPPANQDFMEDDIPF